ncbi:LacI family transcriptional regulator [Silvibacterium dinghuense]|uniref:LacI family transcriptional regulator n=2 Tax=Silvibacterium dinghuense TaxID=1560006 RepID=A0A4Q1SHJ3_9BACT|nr:LacI family transcriptional regulator [Silvibacterium dinghuense]
MKCPEGSLQVVRKHGKERQKKSAKRSAPPGGWNADAQSMRTIAQLAGVSSATVSRVINGSTAVREETAERVRQVIREQRYFPNTSAITMKYGRSGTYGVILPDITNPFYPDFVRNFEAILLERNLELLLATTDFHTARIQQSIRRMLVRRVDGVAFLSSEEERDSLAALVHNRVPVVTADLQKTAVGVSDVAIGFAQGMAEAVRYLHGLGHREIGFVGGNEGITTSNVRRDSFVAAMQGAGLAVHEELLLTGDYRISGGVAAAESLLQIKRRPTAILTANDLTAIGVLRELHRRGVRVPEEISLVGCDDIEYCDIVSPPLTTLRISRLELAQRYMTALEAGRDVTQKGKQYWVVPTLVIRSSTGPAPKAVRKKRQK